jgi:hypothetical protein
MFSLAAMIWPAAAVHSLQAPVDDQTYTEAVMENAVRDSDETIARLSNLFAIAGSVSVKVSAAAERMKLVAADKNEVIRRASGSG